MSSSYTAGQYAGRRLRKKALAGKPIKADSKKSAKKKPGTGVVKGRTVAQGSKAPDARKEIQSGSGSKTTGRERTSKLRGAMRVSLSWKDQLDRYF